MEGISGMKAIGDVSVIIKNSAENQPVCKVYRFDVFKGQLDSEGKVEKLKSVGSAYLRDGLRTYNLTLKALLKDQFYLLPNTKEGRNADFVILTREPGINIGRKYFWNNVGEGHFLDGANHGLMKLHWDILGPDLYMCLHPMNISDSREDLKADQAA